MVTLSNILSRKRKRLRHRNYGWARESPWEPDNIRIPSKSNQVTAWNFERKLKVLIDGELKKSRIKNVY